MRLSIMKQILAFAESSGSLKALSDAVSKASKPLAAAIMGGSQTAISAFEGFSLRHPMVTLSAIQLAVEWAVNAGMKMSTDLINGWADSVYDGDYPDTLKQAIKVVAPDIIDLIAKTVGDGVATTIWGTEEASSIKELDKNLVAMETVHVLVQAFGSVNTAESVYTALHALEPQHFSMYRDIKKRKF